MGLPNCVILRTPAALVWSDPAVAESLRRQIAADPGKVVRNASSRPVKIGSESLIVETELTVGTRTLPVAVKQYRPRTLWKVLAALVRPAKATENWRKAEFLIAHGIATPQPLLACQPRGWPMSSTSFLITAWIGGAENLHLFGWRITARPLDVRLHVAAQCAEALGCLLGRMHASGAAHRDLKAANLLVVENGSDLVVCLIDLDGLQPGSQVPFQRQAHDLARLAVGLTAHPWVTRSIGRRFLRSYLEEFPGKRTDWKPLWRAIVSETAKYLHRKWRRGRQVL